MALTAVERKQRLLYGEQHEVAKALGVSEAYVSKVMNGETSPKTKEAKALLRRCQLELARRMRPRVAVHVAFPPKVERELARAS